MLGDSNFLGSLLNFDKDKIQEKSIRAVKQYQKVLADEGIDEPEKIKKSSGAAFGLLTWVFAIVNYYGVAKTVADASRGQTGGEAAAAGQEGLGKRRRRLPSSQKCLRP